MSDNHYISRDKDTWWPFPITPSLRRMEQQLYETLDLPRGAAVLDAGCGVGHVALFMARRGGFHMTAVDVVEHHVTKARRNIRASGLPAVTVRRADYHHLDFLADASLDGVYTMETLVHATDLERVLRGFFRVLKPGGHVAHHEYETVNVDELNNNNSAGGSRLADDVHSVAVLSAMPLDPMRAGTFKKMLEKVGFVDVQVTDYSDNVRPMLRLFFAMAIVPYLFVKMFRLEKYFVNMVAGAGGLRGQKYWRYISVRATKPGGLLDVEKTK